MHSIDHECPLCGAPAVCEEVDHFARNFYNCPTCTIFGITKVAEKKLAAAVRPQLSLRARAATKAGGEAVPHMLEIQRVVESGDQGVEADVVTRSEHRCYARLPGRRPLTVPAR